jgi:hypothetical protein
LLKQQYTGTRRSTSTTQDPLNNDNEEDKTTKDQPKKAQTGRYEESTNRQDANGVEKTTNTSNSTKVDEKTNGTRERSPEARTRPTNTKGNQQNKPDEPDTRGQEGNAPPKGPIDGANPTPTTSKYS